MDRFLAVIFSLVLLGCQPKSASAPGVEGREPREPIGCPSLPAATGYAVTAQNGPDFVLCAVHDSRRSLRASLYIGNFPPEVPGLRFASFTANSGRNLTWFSTAGDSTGNRTWLTYVPTDNSRSAVLAISVHAKDRQDFLERGPALASQLIGASIAP